MTTQYLGQEVAGRDLSSVASLEGDGLHTHKDIHSQTHTHKEIYSQIQYKCLVGEIKFLLFQNFTNPIVWLQCSELYKYSTGIPYSG